MSHIVLDKKGIKDFETKHSDFLAWLIDPSESHGLGDLFMKCIIERHIKERSDLLKEDLSDMTVYRESSNIDIRAVSYKHRFAVVIENKTLSYEIPGQLKRYEDTMDSFYLGHDTHYIYLTLNGQKASRDRWKAVSYGDIIDLLEYIKGINKGTGISDILCDYIEVIKGNGSLTNIFKKISMNDDGFTNNTAAEESSIGSSVREIIDDYSESGWIRTPFFNEGTHIHFTTPAIYDVCRKIGVPLLLYYDLRLGGDGRPWITLYLENENSSNSDVRKKWFRYLLDTEYYNNPRRDYTKNKFIFSKWICSLRSHGDRRRDEVVDNLRFFFEVHLERIDEIIKGIHRMINGLDDSIDTEISSEKIIRKMKELSDVIGYSFNDITNLEKAFYTRKMTKEECDANSDNYCNSSMATLGDIILKLLIADYLYSDGISMGAISEIKSKLESNKNFCVVSRRIGLEHYAYNEEFFFDEAPPERRLPDSSHNLYLEALAFAIYKDSGLEGCREWFERVLLERLIQCSNE